MARLLECCATGEGAGPGLEDAEAIRLAVVFKALGDPARLRMVSMIAAVPELCVCEITPAFELSSATVSHHLKTLREAGLVDCERRGTFVYYWIAPQMQRHVVAMLAMAHIAHDDPPSPHATTAP